MTEKASRYLVALAVAALAASCALARPPQVRDRANLYPPNAIPQANEIIAQIYDDYDINILIETGVVPPDGRFQSLIRKAWQRFFPNHTAGRSRSPGGERTIYVRLIRQPAPGTVEIEVGPDPQLQRGFPEPARAELRRLLLASLQPRDAASGLGESMAFVQRTLRGTLGAPFDWGLAVSIILGLVAVWLCLEGLRALCRRHKSTAEVGGQVSGAGTLGPALFTMMIRGDYRNIFPSVRTAGREESGQPAELAWQDHDPHEPAGMVSGEAWAERYHQDDLSS